MNLPDQDPIVVAVDFAASGPRVRYTREEAAKLIDEALQMGESARGFLTAQRDRATA